MKTQEIYYTHDYIKSWTTNILEIIPAEKGYAIVLEESAFYPGGGGQPCDLGTINGQQVIQVYKKEGIIYHVVEEEPGKREKVLCTIDSQRRLDLSQQHTGQHLLSSVFYQLYQGETSSFHLGIDYVSIDISISDITNEQIKAVEDAANQYVYRDLPLQCYFVEKSQLQTLPLRKYPTVDKDIRIVEIEKIDYSPCGGTHLDSTGQLGMIKIIKTEHYKGATRAYFKCGKRALQDYQNKGQIFKQLTSKLSMPEEELVERVIKETQRMKELSKELEQWKKKSAYWQAKHILFNHDNFIISEIFEDKHFEEMEKISQEIINQKDVVVIFASQREKKILFHHSGNCSPHCGKIFKKYLSSYGGRGGGSNKKAQAVFASDSDLEGFYHFLIEKIQAQELPLLQREKHQENFILLENNKIALKFKYLIHIIENLNNSQSFQETVDYIYSSFLDLIPYQYIGIALIQEDGKSIKSYHGVSDDHDTIVGLPENLFGLEVKIKNTTLGSVMEKGEARIINDLEEHVKHRPERCYNNILLEAGIRSSITLPLTINGQPIGFIFFSSSKKNIYKEEHAQFLKIVANSISISFAKNKFTDDLVYSSILALAKLAESRDSDTGDHLYRMKKYSRLVAELLYKDKTYPKEMDLIFIEDIERFSPLHDIGKVGIKDGILLKPGKLTNEEFTLMKEHTQYGAQVLKSAENNLLKSGRSIFGMGIEIAAGHHEKWDGSGYPKGIRGKEIPLSARIVAVGDVFDALTSQRPYKKPFSFERAFQIITQGKGSHFDPNIIEIVQHHKKELHDLYEELKDQ